MKISKKALLVVGIVVFAVVFGMLVRTYIGQAQEQKQLRTDIKTQQTLLQTLTNSKKDLEDKLSAAQSLFDSSKVEFPESVESIEYGEDLFAIAEDCNLELTSISLSTPGTRTAGVVAYSVVSFAVNVEGSIENVLKFIYALRTGDDFRRPWSAEIQSISMDISEQTTAIINLNVYGFRG